MSVKTCECGCGAPVNKRYVVGHNTRKSPLEYVEEDRGHKTPCWVWQRSLSAGYGSTHVNGTHRHAHRVIYERERGLVPDGLVLDHLCRVPACVNPDHLEPVTQAENCRRGARVKYTLEQIREIKESDEPYPVLAARFGTHRDYICHIKAGRRWANV